MNSTAPIIKINNLTVGGIYKFYVVSRNENGTSLPSSILTLNVSESAWNGVTVKGIVQFKLFWISRHFRCVKKRIDNNDSFKFSMIP